MIENIAGIKIKGAFFEQGCELLPFALAATDNPKPRYISIIYGKNGSGKTSLSQGFYEVATGKNEFSTLEIVGHSGSSITESIDKNSIFVFNEHYIRREIRFDTDGLGSVVMLGEQVELDEQIKKKETERNDLTNKINVDSSSYDASYEVLTNPLSPEYHLNLIKENLRQNWAARESNIKNLRQNASVRDDFIATLFDNDTLVDLDDAKAEFDDLLLQLKSAQSGERINENLSLIVDAAELENKIIDLLCMKIDEPMLSDREQLIMDIINANPENERLIMKSKEVFSDDAVEICPLCLQPIDTEHKNSLLRSISKIFDTDDAKQHRSELTSINIQAVQMDLQKFKVIDNALCDSIQELIGEYNNIVSSIYNKIKQKLGSVYSPILFDELGLANLQKQINQQIEALIVARNTYNGNIDSIESLKANLSALNKSCAKEEVRQLYVQYQKQIKEKEDKKAALEKKRNDLNVIVTSIEELSARKKNTHIAIEIINEYLAYIFFDKNRLKLEQSSGKYIVKCRGRHVPLKSLSMGERNVIALCYFLSILFHGKLKDDIYKDKCLLVLDDPISSFDFDNKIGMCSFLRHVFSKIHSGNRDSRCLILTHEIETTFNMMKVCADLLVNNIVYELKNKELIPFSKNYNEYSFLVRRVFSYANMDTGYSEFNENIGNIMRRVLEAFGTFVYKKGIEHLSMDADILATIQDANKRDYFANLMYRLVLHGESHLEAQTQGIPDTNLFTYISESEKVRTAKEILIFINLLNPLHLKAHLKQPSDNVNDMMRQVNDWENEIFIQSCSLNEVGGARAEPPH